MIAKYQEFFKDLKKKGIVVLNDWAWDRPLNRDFNIYGADAKLYVKSLRDNTITKFGNNEINMLMEYPDSYVYVTADELKQFETVTYPKLYAEWQKGSEACSCSEAC